jgi:hypothetical protein
MDLGEPASKWLSWQKNAGVEALVEVPRNTMLGDVIVDPNGQAYLVERSGFKGIALSERTAATVDQHLEGAADRGIVHQSDREVER